MGKHPLRDLLPPHRHLYQGPGAVRVSFRCCRDSALRQEETRLGPHMDLGSSVNVCGASCYLCCRRRHPFLWFICVSLLAQETWTYAWTSAPFDVDDNPLHLGQVDQTGADTLKVDNVQEVNKANHSSILQPSPNGPSPMSGSPAARIHDSASIHSLAAVQVTEPQPSPPLPRGPDIPSQSSDDGTTPAERMVGSSTSARLPLRRRSAQSRVAMDVRRCCVPF